MIKNLVGKKDERGVLYEIFKAPGFGQVFLSTTKPGKIRGNHYHNRKIEKFCVLEGKAELKLRDRGTKQIQKIKLSGSALRVVEIPINTVHSILNTGNKEMTLLGITNEIFDPKDPDTFFEEI